MEGWQPDCQSDKVSSIVRIVKPMVEHTSAGCSRLEGSSGSVSARKEDKPAPSYAYMV